MTTLQQVVAPPPCVFVFLFPLLCCENHGSKQHRQRSFSGCVTLRLVELHGSATALPSPPEEGAALLVSTHAFFKSPPPSRLALPFFRLLLAVVGR
jgi:hypothetical protein